MNTQKISYSFRLIRNPRCIDGNDGTLFKFVPVSDPSRSGVPFGSYVRIQHVLTKCWMHAATETELRSSSLSPTPVALTLTPDPTDTTDNSQPSLSQQHPNQQQQQQQQQPTRFFSTDSSSADDQIQSSTSATGSPISKISASQEFHYHDCFSITLVDNQLSDTFNIVNELLPQLQCFLMQSRPVSDGTIGSRFPISDEEHILITDILVWCKHVFQLHVKINRYCIIRSKYSLNFALTAVSWIQHCVLACLLNVIRNMFLFMYIYVY